MITQKICRKCQVPKALAEFEYNSLTFRRRRKCKSCCDFYIKGKERDKAEIDRIKKIMSVPVNLKCTQAYYMGKRFKQEQREVRVR